MNKTSVRLALKPENVKMPDFNTAELREIHRSLAWGTPEAMERILTTTAVSPPDGGVSAPSFNQPVTQDFSKLKVIKAGYRVAYLDFKTSKDPGKRGALTFDAHYADMCSPEQRNLLAPCWWLPWESRHMTKLKIEPLGPQLTDSNGQNIHNPSLFFTAALSGCSVFVRGHIQEPRIYHGGITGDLFDKGKVKGVFNKKEMGKFKLGRDSASFWRRVLGGMDYGPGGMKFDGNYKTGVSEVNLNHYVSDHGTNTTVNADGLERFLKSNQQRNGIEVHAVMPWGSVFGVRDRTTWSFYMQQNATVVYARNGAQMTECVLLSCTKFFPGQGEASPPVLRSSDFEQLTAKLA